MEFSFENKLSVKFSHILWKNYFFFECQIFFFTHPTNLLFLIPLIHQISSYCNPLSIIQQFFFSMSSLWECKHIFKRKANSLWMKSLRKVWTRQKKYANFSLHVFALYFFTKYKQKQQYEEVKSTKNEIKWEIQNVTAQRRIFGLILLRKDCKLQRYKSLENNSLFVIK